MQCISYIWSEISLSACLIWEINQTRAHFSLQRQTGMAWLAHREQLSYLSQHTQGSSIQISHYENSECMVPRAVQSPAWHGLTKEMSWHRQSSAWKLSSRAMHTTWTWSLWMTADGHGVSVYLSHSQGKPELRPSTVLVRLNKVVFQTLPICPHSELPSPRDANEPSEICYKMHLWEKTYYS